MRSAAPAYAPHPHPHSRTHRSRSCHWSWRPAAPWGPGLKAPEVRGSWTGCRDLSQRDSGTRNRWGRDPGVGRVTRAPKGRVLGEESPCALGNTGRWGINSGAGAHALLGCDRSWVPATESSAQSQGQERGGGFPGPAFRLSRMPVASSVAEFDALRDGTEEGPLGGASFQ